MPTSPAFLAAPLRPRLMLTGARDGIDGIDDAIVALAAARAWLVRRIGAHKREHGLPTADPERESTVLRRARGLAARLALAPDTAEQLCAVLIAAGHRQQRASSHPETQAMIDTVSSPAADSLFAVPTPPARRLLRWLPPPKYWARLLRHVPATAQVRLLAPLLQQALAPLLVTGDLDFMHGRRLGIEVADLGLGWLFTLESGALRVVPDAASAEASIRGSATDLLLMASRLEDADTLFFQRRLELTGDTELGLTARNLLDRLPFESLPLALRIGLNRAARLAQAARAAHHGQRNVTA